MKTRGTAFNRIAIARCSVPTIRKTIWFFAARTAHTRGRSRSAVVARFMRQAGLEGVSLHSLRHTHASELLSKGVPLRTEAKRLGHANPNITLAIYAHAVEADEMAAAKIWNDVIAPKKPEPNGMLANVSAME